MAKKPRDHGTPATVALTRAGIEFETLTYEHDPRAQSFGLEAADALGLDPACVFKTLVAQTDRKADHGLVVAIIPVSHQLSLKSLAAAVGAKKATMADKTVVERTTGYVVGGVSPLGQKRPLTTVVDTSAEGLERMYVSGGKRGFDLGLAPSDLVQVLGATYAELTA